MYQQKHKIKAAVLLLVFSLNTVISFACSVGLVNFSKDHHKNDVQHSHDKPHSHDEVSHSHSENNSDHQHLETNVPTSNEEENNCCSDDVMKVSALDKAVTSVNQNPLPLPVEVLAAIYAFILQENYKAALLIKPKPPSDRSWTLSDHTNIRIAIQSFQI